MTLTKLHEGLSQRFRKYMIVNIGLIGLNIFTGSPYWCIYPLVIWGAILLFKEKGGSDE